MARSPLLASSSPNSRLGGSTCAGEIIDPDAPDKHASRTAVFTIMSAVGWLTRPKEYLHRRVQVLEGAGWFCRND